MKLKFFSIIIFSFILSIGCNNTEKITVLIKLSEPEFIRSLADNNNDSIFNKAFRLAEQNYNSENEDFIDNFSGQLKKICSSCRMSAFFNTFENKDKISSNSTDSEVIAVLKAETETAKSKTVLILQKRIETAFKGDSWFSKIFRKTDVVINKMPKKNTYSIALNKKINDNRLKNLLETQVDFGFFETFDVSEIWNNINSANKKSKEMPDFENSVQLDSLNNKYTENQRDTVKEEYNKKNPFFALLNPPIAGNNQLIKSCVVGYSRITDTTKVNRILALSEIKNLFPRNLKFLWSAKPFERDVNFLSLCAIKVGRDGKAILTSDCITSAEVEDPYRSSFETIKISMNTEGTRIWAVLTKENIGKQIAIVNKNSVFSFPTVMSEIKEGRSEISGNFTAEEASNLACVLNSGTMPKIKVSVLEIK
jgi:SecD/SecF fusion protein